MFLPCRSNGDGDGWACRADDPAVGAGRVARARAFELLLQARPLGAALPELRERIDALVGSAELAPTGRVGQV